MRGQAHILPPSLRTPPLFMSAPHCLPMQFTGYLSVPGPGSWSFMLSSDDGSRLLLDDVVVILNGGYHGDVAVTYTNPNLTAGLHSIQYAFGSAHILHDAVDFILYRVFIMQPCAALRCRVDFFQGGGGGDVHLYWMSAANGISNWQIIPTQYLSTPE